MLSQNRIVITFVLLMPIAGFTKEKTPDQQEVIAAEKDSAENVEPPIVPPTLLARKEPAFPSALQAKGILSGDVTVILSIGEDGQIGQVELVSTDDPAFFEALKQTLRYWRFSPASRGDTPIKTRMKVTWNFKAPPPKRRPKVKEIQLSRVTGQVFSRGIRRPVAGLVMRFEPGAFEVFTDENGRFVFDAPPGPYVAHVNDPAFRPARLKCVVGDEPTALDEWKVTPENLDESSVVVVGRKQRETQRISLDRFELSHVPGTMGDPLRVIQSLPGVGTVASFVPFPIVRGAPPGDTGYFIDETSIPLLFHLGIGTSVLHPQLIDKVNFYPGVAPIRYGRFVGGAVEAKTRLSEKDIWIGDLDINLFQTGALISAPLNEGKTRVTAGGRFSYTGLLLSLLASDIYLNFWDYVLRVDHRFQNDHSMRLSAFGAQDEMGDGDNAARRIFVDFHRVNGRYSMPVGDHRLTFGLDLGGDRLDSPGGDDDDEPRLLSDGENVEEDRHGRPKAALREYSVRPRLIWETELSDTLRLETGADMEIRPGSNNTSNNDDDGSEGWRPDNFISPENTKYVFGVFHALTLRRDAWQITPGIRFDYYENVDRLGIDPRLGVRYRLSDMTTLKTGLGLSHAQQRFFVPIPGLGDLELESPLQESWQVTTGIEHRVGNGYSLDANIYYAHRRHLIQTVFERDEDSELGGAKPEVMDGDVAFEIPLQDGRAFGAEIIFRRQRTAKVFGWIAYTLQRVERQLGDEWRIDPLDQTHIFNLVASWRFAPDYIWGVRFHYNTGRPQFEGGDRLDAFFQIDTRLDILWVKDDYQVDFYLDVINLTYNGEQLSGDDSPVKYILPTIGAHGTF
jgi:TonB family protein